MTKVSERYFMGVAVLFMSIALLFGTKLTVYLYAVSALGLISSDLFLLGAKNTQGLIYKWAIRLLYLQISIFFIFIAFSMNSWITGTIIIALGLVVFKIIQWLLRLME